LSSCSNTSTQQIPDFKFFFTLRYLSPIPCAVIQHSFDTIFQFNHGFLE